MRRSTPTPTDEPLPLTGTFGGSDSSAQGPVLRPEAVAQFDALVHELNPDAVRIDVARLRHLCTWLASLPANAAREVLDRRLHRLEELRAMLEDADWDADDALRERLRKLFAYIDHDQDLIPDREPLLGKLDDVLLIELAWPAFVTEAEEYRDFCAYREEAHPDGDGATRRNAWLRDRCAEIALWQHHARVNDSHYAEGGRPYLFHVGG